MLWKSSCHLLKIFRNGLNKHKNDKIYEFMPRYATKTKKTIYHSKS